MDCARTAVRAGAEEVSIVYRRRRDDMTALPSEIEAAVAEGVELLTLQSPAGIEVDEDGNCCALLVQPQMAGPIRGGRPTPVDASKPQVRLDVDIILMAIGQSIESAEFAEFGLETDRDRLVSDDFLEGAGYEGKALFVGGECQTGPATVIRAIGAGKVAARNIDEYLGYHHKLDCGATAPAAKLNNRVPTGRANISGTAGARAQARLFRAPKNEMSLEEVEQECGRCLRCDHYGCGNLEGGRHPAMLSLTINGQAVTAREGMTHPRRRQRGRLPASRRCAFCAAQTPSARAACASVELEGQDALRCTACNDAGPRRDAHPHDELSAARHRVSARRILQLHHRRPRARSDDGLLLLVRQERRLPAGRTCAVTTA